MILGLCPQTPGFDRPVVRPNVKVIFTYPVVIMCIRAENPSYSGAQPGE